MYRTRRRQREGNATGRRLGCMHVRSLTPCLKIFYDAPMCVFGSSYDTSNRYMKEAFYDDD